MKRGSFDRFALARTISAVPYKINSGSRCQKHNKEVGGSDTSSHLTGEAGDIAIRDSAHRWRVLDGLLKAGFNRIGIGETFIHADDDIHKTPGVIWLY